MVFILGRKERERLDWWLNIHDRVCPLTKKPTPAIGGRLTYCFTPIDIGEIVTVKCACGAEVGLTDTGKM